MDLLQAIFLGIVEGLTEFLPISSTGHLILAEEYIGFKDAAKVFTVVIQFGAILAVIWYYRKDLLSHVRGLFSGRQGSLGFWQNLVIATIPASILGLMLEDHFESYATAMVVALALIIGGIILWAVDRNPVTDKPEPVKVEAITSKQALIVGLVQCVALIPGASRSGASIVGGLFSKMNRPTATAFSFYLGIPVLGLAGAYKLISDWDQLDNISGGGVSIIAGGIAAFITALIAVSWLLKYISTHNFRLFAYYRIILGSLVLIALALK